MASDIKSLNKSAENLFHCGHVQNIEFVKAHNFTYIKAKCLPEMRKDRMYMLKLVLKSEELEIVLQSVVALLDLDPKEVASTSLL
jgi:hypothetical protein